MKKLNQYILEKLKINKDSKVYLNIYDVEEYIQKFSERGIKYKKYFTTSINDDELSLTIKPINKLYTTRDFDKFKAFAKSIAFYLEDELETPVGILDYVNFGVNKLKEETQKTLYVEWNYKLQTITVTLNK